MKRWKQIISVIIIGILLCEIMLWVKLHENQSDATREYRLEIERLTHELQQTSIKRIDLSNYPSIKSITPLLNQEETSFFEGGNDDYVIRKVNEQYIRIDYEKQNATREGQTYVFLMILSITASLLMLLYWYIKTNILTPYTKIAQLPYELAKGNLHKPLPAQKDQELHHFLWGLDVLREELEQTKQKQLQLQKEKKTLILSLSHDIKTPLSSIKLYASALEKHLYDDPFKLQEIASNIQLKTTEIESFVAQIVTASKEDFLELDIEVKEFYYDELIDEIYQYYHDKLQLLKIPLEVSQCANCLLKGELSFGVEAIQNAMENAIKYGDGSGIKLVTQEEEDCRLLHITNGGCTLLPHELPHIFDSFYRGTNASDALGSGLGLYIAKTIMEKMDGSIYATIKHHEITITFVFRKV